MNVRRTILRSELLRFSHYVPAFRLTSERGGAPRGYYELDSAVVSRIKRQEQDASMEGKENVHNVLCMVKKWQETFSKGWSPLAQEYPLSLDDMCTFDLVKSTEFVLTSKPAR
ncbi:hypothetical protein F2Q68_00006894 [Brassica cretica]|uniref:Uncharacterized protein n=1 Tax=Brassica cretica TaxID=69181 RepID=A0A8S9JKH8_BRACR|nr:hypothetical protein F2Q68_00006894 [Brassica cretica]